jgi:predicted CXXCH cytochrome family protein
MLVAKNDKNAPVCTECHGSHGIMSKSNYESPIFARNIPNLCGRCHREGEKAALRYTGAQHDIVKHYQMSIHGRGLSQSGLMVSATCTNCHTAHSMLPAADPKSSVNRDNIISACAQCHLGIAEKFSSSIHSPKVSKTDKKLPVCNDCHTSHSISRHDTAGLV